MRKCLTISLVEISVLVIFCLTPRFARAEPSSPTEQAVWVWPSQTDGTPISDPTARHALIQNGQNSRVTDLLVSVYQSTLSPTGRQLFAD
jgi:hypothetical protein